MTKALPCMNTQQIAAKTISKDQQTLLNYIFIILINRVDGYLIILIILFVIYPTVWSAFSS
jgi:hypothetical protein